MSGLPSMRFAASVTANKEMVKKSKKEKVKKVEIV
jgi:hypothetical protein